MSVQFLHTGIWRVNFKYRPTPNMYKTINSVVHRLSNKTLSDKWPPDVPSIICCSCDDVNAGNHENLRMCGSAEQSKGSTGSYWFPDLVSRPVSVTDMANMISLTHPTLKLD